MRKTKENLPHKICRQVETKARGMRMRTPFNIYVSGIDTSRSSHVGCLDLDVNIIMTVKPKDQASLVDHHSGVMPRKPIADGGKGNNPGIN